MPRITLIINSELENVGLVGRTVNKLCSDLFQETEIWNIELGVVEAVTNVIKHSYSKKPNGMVKIMMQFEEETVQIVIQDSGEPLDKNRVDLTGGKVIDFDPKDRKSLPEGGMGLFLINQSVDKINYLSENGVNTLTLLKKKNTKRQ